MSQGIGVITGLQKSFNWAGVAAAGVGAGVANAMSDALLGQQVQDANGNSSRPNAGTAYASAWNPGGGGSNPLDSTGKLLAGILSGMAAGTAAAAMRGGKFTVQQVATDAFGNAIGNSIVDNARNSGSGSQQTVALKDAYSKAAYAQIVGALGQSQVASNAGHRILLADASQYVDTGTVTDAGGSVLFNAMGDVTSVGGGAATPPHGGTLPPVIVTAPRETIGQEAAEAIAGSLGWGYGFDPTLSPWSAAGLNNPVASRVAGKLATIIVDNNLGPRAQSATGLVLSGYGAVAGLAAGNPAVVAVSLDQMYASAKGMTTGQYSPTLLNHALTKGLGFTERQAAYGEMALGLGAIGAPTLVNAAKGGTTAFGNAVSRCFHAIEEITMISSFKKIRADGLVISEDMTPEQIAALGEVSCTVTAQWDGRSGLVTLTNENGLWAQVLPRRDAVAVKEALDESRRLTSLRVVNEDGSDRFTVSRYQLINGVDRVGTFAWYETPRTGRPNCFSVVFVALTDESFHQLDIDGSSGEVVGVYPTR